MTEWLLLGVAVLLIAANAVFVAAEFSLVTVDRTAVAAQARSGDAGATRVLQALRTLSTQLSGAQLGITVTSLVVGFLAEPSLAALLRGPLQSAGVSGAAVTGVSVTAALLVATAFQMVLGELVPKTLAIARPLPVARVAGPAQVAFSAAARPVLRFLNGTANAILRRMGVQPQEELASARSPEELRSLVRRSAELGTMPAPTATLIDRSLRFGDRTAADVLTPRVRVRFLGPGDTAADAVERARTTGHSRFPVQGSGGVDDIVGVVHLKNALRVPRSQRPSTPVAQVADPPLLVPETIELDPLLRLLRAESQLAVVVDEYGGTAGIVSLEDLVEELVGEVEDEHDRPGSRVRRTRGGGYLVSGLLRPDEVRGLGVPVPDGEDYDTVAGFLAAELDRVPEVGDTVTVGAWDAEVVRRDGLRVDRVRLRPTTGPGRDGAT